MDGVILCESCGGKTEVSGDGPSMCYDAAIEVHLGGDGSCSQLVGTLSLSQKGKETATIRMHITKAAYVARTSFSPVSER